jgi:hypothetical protein
LADLLQWGTRRGPVAREERARLRAAHAAALARLDDESAEITEEEALRGLALVLQTVRSLLWQPRVRRFTPLPLLEALDNAAGRLIDAWIRPRRRRR